MPPPPGRGPGAGRRRGRGAGPWRRGACAGGAAPGRAARCSSSIVPGHEEPRAPGQLPRLHVHTRAAGQQLGHHGQVVSPHGRVERIHARLAQPARPVCAPQPAWAHQPLAWTSLGWRQQSSVVLAAREYKKTRRSMAPAAPATSLSAAAATAATSPLRTAARSARMGPKVFALIATSRTPLSSPHASCVCEVPMRPLADAARGVAKTRQQLFCKNMT